MNPYDIFNIVGGYRKQKLFHFLVDSKFADKLINIGENADAELICRTLGWDKSFGFRFLETLVLEGILRKYSKYYKPSQLLIDYFSEKSKYYQGYNIRFENYLLESWVSLPEALTQGKRVFSTELKSNKKYRKDLELYIRAMDNVATLRANELFDNLNFQKSGLLVDLAGGSGSYVYEFLFKYGGWEAIHFDTPEVSYLAKKLLKEKVNLRHYPALLKDKIIYNTIDFIRDEFPKDIKADCILLSNIIHCYNNETIEKLADNCHKLLKENGIILVHDFFKDNETGAMYDIHMMLNTYTGKTYFKDEFIQIMENKGFKLNDTKDLPSQSSFITFNAQLEK